MTSMKFKDLERLLYSQGAQPVREGKGSHMIWRKGNLTASVPRHRLVSAGSLRDIFKHLGIDYKGLNL